MKILHLASFAGNVGDIANHESFYVNLKENINEDIQIDKLEIREFYKNSQLRYFDESFVDLVNRYDLFVFGGGNFFELKWDYSTTGTTFNIDLALLKKITTPIFINGMGIDIGKGYNEENIEKFRAFLHELFNETNVFFTVRNDGSMEVVRRYFSEFEEKIHVIPDHGFFINDVEFIKEYHSKDKKYIGINLAIDMPEVRFKNRSYEDFCDDLAELLDYVVDELDKEIIFFPHILTDYEAILKLTSKMNNLHTRTHVSIAPLIQNNELSLLKLYKDCHLVIGMRNHTSICTVGLQIPSLAIVSYEKPKKIYEEINLVDRFIDINDSNLFGILKEEIEALVSSDMYENKIVNQYDGVLESLKTKKATVYNYLKNWIRQF